MELDIDNVDEEQLYLKYADLINRREKTMKDTNETEQTVDTLTERLDRACIKAGLTPNWVDKTGDQFK